MAKLNGVTTVNERIQYNGVEYVRSDEKAVAGDVIRISEETANYVTDGGYYEIYRVKKDGIACFADEDEDEFDVDGLDDVPAVFKRAASETAPADIVEHNGVRYRKVARKAKAGDLIYAVKPDHKCNDYEIGFTTKLYDDGDLVFKDEVNDRRLYIEFGHDANFVVLEPIASAEPAPSYATSLPATLPSEYVIHDGRVYATEQRKANVGETVIIIEKSGTVNKYQVGDVLSVSKRPASSYVYLDGEKYVSYDSEYAILVPVTSVTLGGNEYTLEQRKAAVGERVLFVQTFCFGKAGAVETVMSLCGNGGIRTANVELATQRRYVVLSPKAAASTTEVRRSTPQPMFTEVRRKANVGERIRIVNAFLTGGRYRNGAEFTVDSVAIEGHVHVSIDGKSAFITLSEYVVLAEVVEQREREKVAAEPPQPSRLQVGEYARVKPNAIGFIRDIIGHVVTVANVMDSGYIVRSIDGKITGSAFNSELERESAADVEQAEEARKQAEAEREERAEAERLLSDIVGRAKERGLTLDDVARKWLSA